ncbi:MAG: hypothetical protein ACP5EN_13130 [Rhodovulum sp.]
MTITGVSIPPRDAAREALIEGWGRNRQPDPDASCIILTHTNSEVQALNAAARETDELGAEVELSVERGRRTSPPCNPGHCELEFPPLTG